MIAKLEAARFDGGTQFRVLRQDQRRPVATFQPQPVPDDKCPGLGRQRNQPEEWFAGDPLDPFASDHTVQILPGWKAVADRDDGMFAVVVAEEFILRGLDLRQDRGRIGGGRSPLFTHGFERVGSQTGIRQIRGRTAQLGQRRPQIGSCDMRQLERDPVETSRVGIGDAARDQ